MPRTKNKNKEARQETIESFLYTSLSKLEIEFHDFDYDHASPSQTYTCPIENYSDLKVKLGKGLKEIRVDVFHKGQSLAQIRRHNPELVTGGDRSSVAKELQYNNPIKRAESNGKLIVRVGEDVEADFHLRESNLVTTVLAKRLPEVILERMEEEARDTENIEDFF